MTSIADILGIDWDAAIGEAPQEYTLTKHAKDQAALKQFSVEDVLRAANDPTIVTDNGRYPGQKRHTRGNIVAVVVPKDLKVVTVYQSVVRTPLRPGQVALP